MNPQAMQTLNTTLRPSFSTPAEQVKEKRESYTVDNSKDLEKANSQDAIQPEELLNNIKSLTEDGIYSVRFEMHKDTNDLIINLVNSESGELIRQIPPEEIISMHKYIQELRGNIVNTES